MNRHIITIGLLLLATAFYALGFAGAGLGAIIAGGALELWFWIRIARGFNRPDDEASTAKR